jgi:hypothetical protein
LSGGGARRRETFTAVCERFVPPAMKRAIGSTRRSRRGLSCGRPGISYTKRERIVDIGHVYATAEREHTLPLAPIIGIVSVAARVVFPIAAGNPQRLFSRAGGR